MKSMGVDYAEVSSVATDEECVPLSFTKNEEKVKTIFPWLRSYMFRRQLSFAGVASIFCFVGAVVSFVIMKMNDHVPDVGEFNYQSCAIFFLQNRREHDWDKLLRVRHYDW